MIDPIVAPLGLRSIASTADCLDDPAFDGGLKEPDFGFDAASDDFDGTLDVMRTVVGRGDLREVFSGLDLSLLLAIWLSLNDSTTAATGTAPPRMLAGLGRALAFTRAITRERERWVWY